MFLFQITTHAPSFKLNANNKQSSVRVETSDVQPGLPQYTAEKK